MQEVQVKPRSPDLLASILTAARAQAFAETGRRARAGFGDRTIWHVNATAHGGGVAEMLQTLLAYGRGARIDNRWLVLDGSPEFFAITKRLHNLLHGDPGDGGPLGEDERACYERVLGANLAEMFRLINRSDIVVLHDPQTAGLVKGLQATGTRVAWRCHIGRDARNVQTDEGWAFLRPYIEDADAFVFSRREYVPVGVDEQRLVVIPPSIDPFSAKNRELDEPTVTAVLATVGLVGADPDRPVHFERRDGMPGTVRHRGALIADGPPPPSDARLLLQVSRWDRLKDMAGVLSAFVTMTASGPDDAHLMLVGPDVSAVTDDPEGSAVLADCRARWSSLPDSIRARTHIACVVVQKSLAEGFGLTVTEAMWKARPVVASRVGGIQDQIVNDRDGLLIDPYDLDGLAAAMSRLLEEPGLADRLGYAARSRVQEYFLGDRHLAQYVDLFVRLST
jgi:trehalose synthase